jgi:purine-binding chemotaxis protein CheW
MDTLQQNSMNEELQLVVFRLASEEYGLPIEKVHEINRLTPITKLPQTPSFMEGVTNLRGKIIPVFDLRKRFQLSEIEKNYHSCRQKSSSWHYRRRSQRSA